MTEYKEYQSTNEDIIMVIVCIAWAVVGAYLLEFHELIWFVIYLLITILIIALMVIFGAYVLALVTVRKK